MCCHLISNFCEMVQEIIGPKGFLIKSFLFLFIICVPGNLITIILLYKHWSSSDEIANIMTEMNSTEDTYSENTYEDNSTIQVETAFFIPVCDKEGILNSTLKCYECIDEYKCFRENTRFWLEGVMIFIVGIIGLGCNLMVIVILRLCKGNRNFNILLRCLTIADILLILDMMVERLLVYHFDEPVWYKTTYPYFWHPIKGIFLSATIYTVVAVSAERYRAICHPLSRRHSPSKYMSVVIIAAVASKIPRFFHFTVVRFDDGTLEHITTALMEDPTYIWFTAYWDEIVVNGFLPFFILIYFNARIYLKLIASRKMNDCRYSGGLRINRSSRQTTCQSTQEMELATRCYQQNVINSQLQPLPFNKNKRHTSIANHAEMSDTFQINDDMYMVNNDSSSHLGCKSRCSGKKNVGSYFLKRSRSLDEDSTNHLLRRMIARNNTIKSHLAEESRSLYFYRQSCRDSCRKKITTEKTTFILIAIVALFLLTHSYRLSIKFYEAVMPKSNTVDSFDFCFSLGRHHVPVAFYLLFHLNNLFIVISCSANFIIYCCVAKPFRTRALDFFKSCLKMNKDSAMQV